MQEERNSVHLPIRKSEKALAEINFLENENRRYVERRVAKGSVSNRWATIHSNDCTIAARPQGHSSCRRFRAPFFFPPCRLHTFLAIPRPLLPGLPFLLFLHQPTVSTRSLFLPSFSSWPAAFILFPRAFLDYQGKNLRLVVLPMILHAYIQAGIR